MAEQAQQLKRETGVPGAILLGLGSIIGTGVFVSIGVAAGAAGSAVAAAIVIAAIVATCNGLSSAQLAASHPVSGGTYEYGYRYLSPVLGFTAGWMFLCAKTASAATAALGFAGYLAGMLDIDGGLERITIALGAVFVLTIVVLGGLRRSNVMNTVIVLTTLTALLAFVVVASSAGTQTSEPLTIVDTKVGIEGLLQATAMMFVAFTGYGRIATMGEEVKEPRRTIPRAMIATLVVSMLIYAAVAAAAVTSVGSSGLAGAVVKDGAAPLATVMNLLGHPSVALLVSIGAMTAMLGVLLNLILGMSRVWLAMGRRGDMPGGLARINASGTTPVIAVILTSALIAALVCIGDVKLTWSFSAFTVLIYYAITNICALRLKGAERMFSPLLAIAGLIACLFLAFWVETEVWLAGLGTIAAGLIVRAIMRRKIS
ncbi:MAG: APC family permease [Planctomycetes bacterium]|nr:APC family permease [Planctomycetota bacterium]NUQ36043.1 amino acid permease [Planctomycetaceae bacterium]